MPFLAAPKSSTAMRAATTEPGPARSAYVPDWSFMTPIFTTPSEIWAWAPPAASASAASKPRLRLSDMLLPLFFKTPSSNGTADELHAKIVVQPAHVRLELGVGDHIHDPPIF